MKKTAFLSFVFAVTTLTLSARADFITSSTAGVGWQSWNSSVLGTSGRPYWNHSSSDGANSNIGYYMTKTGAFVGGTGPGVASPFWGKAFVSGSGTDVGAADNAFFMTKNGINHAATYMEKVASNDNKFGIFETDATGSVLGAKTLLFDDSLVSPVSGPVNFNPSAYYGFYIEGPDGTFYSLSGFNSPSDSFQHFTVFKENDFTFWIGAEDLRKCESDKDYNDGVYKLTFSEDRVPPTGDPAAVPEPTTVSMMALGLIGAAAVVWSRRKKQEDDEA